MSGEVTVVIPTRDRPALLADALTSVGAQERPAARTVVVDDGSAEPLPTPSGGAVELLRRARPGGVAAARNHGLERVETEWVAFLDDDDLWAPAKLARQLEVAAAEARRLRLVRRRRRRRPPAAGRASSRRPTPARCCRSSSARTRSAARRR